ncbi:5-dehydro-2-deoxygluconokinase [Janibacter sp. GS2]|uniref:5-dehydro-2-deoxygluconokinase n=1 Tax=Janibacter sp. GS2 TaxID=3442646 RepID=UPI003EBC4AEC
MTTLPAPDLLAIGRISVDLYAREAHASFLEPQTFEKSIGGSPTNVAVAGARLGLDSAIVTRVGDDALGDYSRAKLASFGVRTDFVGQEAGATTPVVLVALDEPSEPTIAFYRSPTAPDTLISADAVPDEVLTSARLVWVSAAALATGPTANTVATWLQRRGRSGDVVLDLDLRPTLWSSEQAMRDAAQTLIAASTVVVGNRAECAMAVGTHDPHAAADALLSRGVHLAVVKMGAEGVLLASPSERFVIAPIPVDVRCGLGAGDAFGGVLAAGLVRGWDLERIGRYANAAGALVTSRLTCSDAMPTTDELDAFLSSHEEAGSHV